MSESEKELRWKIFRELFPYYEKLVTPEFLQKSIPCIPVRERVNSIFKVLSNVFCGVFECIGISVRLIDKETAITFGKSKGNYLVNQGVMAKRANRRIDPHSIKTTLKERRK